MKISPISSGYIQRQHQNKLTKISFGEFDDFSDDTFDKSKTDTEIEIDRIKSFYYQHANDYEFPGVARAHAESEIRQIEAEHSQED